jgi:hypothetical protein
MARYDSPILDTIAYGCLTHARFLHPETGEWVQLTPLQLRHVALVYAYCRLQWRVQGIACDQCQESSHTIQPAPAHIPEMPAPHAAA